MEANVLTTEAGILAYLQAGRFPNSIKAIRLSDGFSAFVYRIATEPLANGAVTFIVKHVENYAARSPTFSINQSRLQFEHRALTTLPSLLDQTPPANSRLPKVLHYDDTAHVLVMEDVGNLPSLKAWLTPSSSIASCRQIGTSLGHSLAKIHNLHRDCPSIISEFDANQAAKQLSALVFFGNLPKAAASFGFKDVVISEIAAEAQSEVLRSREVLTYGDYWPGNILVSANSDSRSHADSNAAEIDIVMVDFEFVKPGTRAFDVGQMAAEMYCMARYIDQERGGALLESFLRGYKVHAGQVDTAKVAIRVGAHLVAMGPAGWRMKISQEQLEELVAEGIDMLMAGWKRDFVSLQRSMLVPLLDGMVV